MLNRYLVPALMLALLIALLVPSTLGQEVNPEIDISQSSRVEEIREQEKSNLLEVHPFGATEAEKVPDSLDILGLTKMDISNNLVSKSEARSIEVAVDLGYEPDLDKLEWTFGGLPFEDWKKWTSGTNYDGDPFIYFEVEPYIDDGILDVCRISGVNRWATAAMIAEEAYPAGSDIVIIARGDDAGGWADGLAASFLSGVLDAPILLTAPNNLPGETVQALETLDAEKAYVLGGTGAISAGVEAALDNILDEVERIAGASREATAVQIAAKGGDTFETAIIVQGRAPADSMLVGPLARAHGFPILLVNRDYIPAATEAAVAAFEIENLIVVGGTGVISASVYNQLAGMVDSIERWSGADRFATSVAVASECHADDAFTIVGGFSLADAVGAATLEKPILYVERNSIPLVVKEYLDGVVHPKTSFCILGGNAAVSAEVEAELRTLISNGDGLLKATVKFDLPYDRTNLSVRSVRVRILDLIGNYYLQVKDTDTNIRASALMTLNVYDSFRTYDQIKPELMDIFGRAKHGRYLEYQSLGYSVEGREIPFVVIAQDASDIDHYLDDFLPQMLENPASLQALIDNETIGDYKIPMWINNVHPDEPPGVCAQIDLIEMFATQDYITFNMTDDDYGAGEPFEVVLDVDEVLDNIILLFNITNNPDGRYNMTRGNVLGFDLNRDYGFQTQVETRAVVENIAKWTPISLLDLHGFVTGFLIEPCTPPHEFNLEYDLYLDSALEQAHRMGNAGVANTTGFGTDSYFIPRETWPDGWDDGTLSYTPMYAMQHGALGHTIEMPQLNEENNTLMIYTVLGAIDFTMEKKDELFYNQLEWFRRGVEGLDLADVVDPYFVDPDGNSIGRPRDPHDSFFPDYYVMPLGEEQKNDLEAFRMVETLLRNGIKVHMLNADVGDHDEGSLVVDMRQAKRGLANAFLYQGPDFSEWANMYAEVVAAYPHLRGFDIQEVREGLVFEGLLEEITEAIMPETQVPAAADYYILQTVNNDTILAVNKLLDAGMTVEMIMDNGDGYVMGDFLVSAAGLNMVKDDLYLEVLGLDEPTMNREALVKPEVAAYGWQAQFVIDELGFEKVALEAANVIVDDFGYANSSWMKDRIEEGVPYIGINGYAARDLVTSGLLPGLDRITTRFSHEGTLHSVLDTNSVVTGRYQENEILYTQSGTWLSDVPDTSVVLASLADDEDFFVAGWWPGYEGAQGSPFIITDDSGDARITLFTGDVTNRAHPKHQFRMLANAIYLSALE